MKHSPVPVVDSEPFTVPGSNVNVDRTEVVVFLMAWCTSSRHLHVELDRVHTEDGVTDVGEKVTLRALDLCVCV